MHFPLAKFHTFSVNHTTIMCNIYDYARIPALHMDNIHNELICQDIIFCELLIIEISVCL